MLILRRKAGEAVVIDGTITVYVLAVEGDRIKMGVTAPAETPIVRGELLTLKGEPPPPTTLAIAGTRKREADHHGRNRAGGRHDHDC